MKHIPDGFFSEDVKVRISADRPQQKKANKHPIPPVIFYIKNVLLWLSHLKLNSRARLVLESLHSW